MAKKTAEYTPTAESIQPVVEGARELQQCILNVSRECPIKTIQLALMHISGMALELRRKAIVARSGPDELEVLRSEGHDI